MPLMRCLVGLEGVGADALVEASKFVGIGCVPHGLVHGVMVQLAMFKHLTGGGVDDQGCKGLDQGGDGVGGHVVIGGVCKQGKGITCAQLCTCHDRF